MPILPLERRAEGGGALVQVAIAPQAGCHDFEQASLSSVCGFDRFVDHFRTESSHRPYWHIRVGGNRAQGVKQALKPFQSPPDIGQVAAQPIQLVA
jgi:hypothetical protein